MLKQHMLLKHGMADKKEEPVPHVVTHQTTVSTHSGGYLQHSSLNKKPVIVIS